MSTADSMDAASDGRIAVAIPAFNEDRFICSVVHKARHYAGRVLVIDDGSTDQTAALAEEAGAEVVRHPRNLGKAGAVRSAFRWAAGQACAVLVLLDGDGQHDPSSIPELARPVLEGEADMVVGTRFGAVRSRIPAYRQLGQHALTFATNASSGLPISDSQSGYRAFSRRALERMRLYQDGFAVESEMQFVAKQHGLRVVEVPVHAAYVERAKRNPLAHGMSIMQGILYLLERQRPLQLFGFFGSLSLLLGLGLGVHVSAVYAQTQTLAVGFTLLTVLLISVGVQTAFAGILLHAIRQHLREPRDA